MLKIDQFFGGLYKATKAGIEKRNELYKQFTVRMIDADEQQRLSGMRGEGIEIATPEKTVMYHQALLNRARAEAEIWPKIANEAAAPTRAKIAALRLGLIDYLRNFYKLHPERLERGTIELFNAGIAFTDAEIDGLMQEYADNATMQRVIISRLGKDYKGSDYYKQAVRMLQDEGQAVIAAFDALADRASDAVDPDNDKALKGNMYDRVYRSAVADLERHCEIKKIPDTDSIKSAKIYISKYQTPATMAQAAKAEASKSEPVNQ